MTMIMADSTVKWRMGCRQKLLGGDMTAEEAEALDALLPAVQPRRRKATS
jgi:hypothetical protein